MKADLSRETFDSDAHYTAVRLQQGRVITDADFNEEGDILRHRIEKLAEELIGHSGGALDGAGFALAGGMRALAVHVAGAASVWIAGEDGVLLVSEEGGSHWSLSSITTTRHLRALARSSDTGWVVGDGGTVLRSDNGGSDWLAVDSGSVDALHGVAAFDAQYAWAVGDSDFILRTIDGGASWSRHASGAGRLYAVAFSGMQNGLAVGEGGAVLRSSDGGASWTRVDAATTATLRAVQLAGAQAWAVGDGGTVLRSSDGGASWSAAPSGSSARLRAVCFSADGATGWVAGEDGSLLRSEDGGMTWADRSLGDAGTLAGLSQANSEAVLWVVGGGYAWQISDPQTGGPSFRGTLPAASLLIGAGRYHVEGQPCEWAHPGSLANQADGGVSERLPAGEHLIYLRAWQRHISVLEDPRIGEVALGGPDTATRLRQIAQVRALPLPSAPENESWHCSAASAAWDALSAAPSGRLAARAEPQLVSTGVCELAAAAGYRRLENQLYRVEIHHVDASGAACFKWSRDNGSIACAVTAIRVDEAANRTMVRLAMRGRDATLDFAPGDRVELIDDEAELQDRAGTMFEYLHDGDDSLELVLAGAAPTRLAQDPARHPLLRRWDQRPEASGEHLLPVVEEVWMALEEGVQVRFSAGGRYRPGDYWQIAARTVSGDIEWPRSADGTPLPRPPAGVRDSWARLGLVTVDGNGFITAIRDCRSLFPPLTQLTQLHYVGGDGQAGAPNSALAEPLRARVARGAIPAAGARVRFSVDGGDGSLSLQPPWGTQSGSSVDADCDSDGVVECNWQLGSGAGQRVRVNLLDSAASAAPGQQLVFAAHATVPASVGGARSCAITIGQGGDHAELNDELLQDLLKTSDGHLCICFLPGPHTLKGLSADGGRRGSGLRLSLHGCGPTAVIDVDGPIKMHGLMALQLRDLELRMSAQNWIELYNIAHIELARVIVTGYAREERERRLQPWLMVAGVEILRMQECLLAEVPPVAAVFDEIRSLCEIRHCLFGGDVSFYGFPGKEPSAGGLYKTLSHGRFEVPDGRGALMFSSNQLSRLTMGEKALVAWSERRFDDLFHTVSLNDNVFREGPSLCAGVLLTCSANHFIATDVRDGLYAVFASRLATASGNIGAQVDRGGLVFVTPNFGGGGFRGSANVIVTEPAST